MAFEIIRGYTKKDNAEYYANRMRNMGYKASVKKEKDTFTVNIKKKKWF